MIISIILDWRMSINRTRFSGSHANVQVAQKREQFSLVWNAAQAVLWFHITSSKYLYVLVQRGTNNYSVGATGVPLLRLSLSWACRWWCNPTNNSSGIWGHSFLSLANTQLVLQSSHKIHVLSVSIKLAGNTGSGFIGKLSALQHLSLPSFCPQQPNRYFLEQIAQKTLHCNKIRIFFMFL